MIDKIEQWVDETLLTFSIESESCERLLTHFNGFYPAGFLTTCRFVVVDEIPKPDFPEVREIKGYREFIDMDASAITYKNTYFIKEQNIGNLATHFHELVHVLQWLYLGGPGFISRYITELQTYGYDQAPLELMAYALDNHYSNNQAVFDVPNYVRQNL